MALRWPQWNNPGLELFHGTVRDSVDLIMQKGIDPALGRPNTDFGRGFYATTWIDQAHDWATQKAAARGKEPAVVKITVDRLALRSLRSLAFVRGALDAQDFWSFVDHCRNGGGRAPITERDYDVVYGPVAAQYGPGEYRIYPNMDQIGFHGAAAKRFLSACVVEVLPWPQRHK